MKKSSVQTLNTLNQTFYDQVAESFDDSREYFWPGWQKLLKPLQELATNKHNQPLTVLDIGCGNGRFAQWLDEHSIKAEYTGIDSNSYLLEAARKKNQELPNVKTVFTQVDVIEKILKKQHSISANSDSNHHLPNATVAQIQTFDLIICFGVFHHIPGIENRSHLVEICQNQLAPNGLLAVATWDFSTIPSLMSRSQKLSETTLIPDPEPNDFLLDWKRQDQITPKRYCHLISLQETESWWSSAGLSLVLHYTADGPQNASNHYFIAAHHNH